METFELLKQIIKDFRYKVLEETDMHVLFRYQLNSIYMWTNADDEHFVMIGIFDFAEVNKDNRDSIIKLCHDLTCKSRQVKFYVTDNDVIAVTAEIYFLEEQDLIFQIEKALKNVVMGKSRFNKLAFKGVSL
jgi:hypothetical protein